MDLAIRQHFKQNIKERIQLSGGYTFETWLLVLSSGLKVVFRTQNDFVTGGGRKIIIGDIFKREKFFYDSVNKSIGQICPEVYIIDDTREYYDKPYQISEYIEGIPLNLCFDDFDEHQKSDIYYKIGEIAARINMLKIDEQHPYILCRGPWTEFITARLRERLLPLEKNNAITHAEINRITDNMRDKKAEQTLSFLHLDMRLVNMIYNNGNIFVLDAENCEFGDPLFELAVIDIGGALTAPLLNGYKSTFDSDIDIDSDLFNYYKMERLALVLNVFMNEVNTEKELAQYYLAKFYELKNRLIRFSCISVKTS